MNGSTTPPHGNAFAQYVCFVAALALIVGASLLLLGQGLAPTILSLAPGSINAGSAGFTLTANGTGFSAIGSSLRWNGAPQATTFVSSTQVTAAIPASFLTSAGYNGVTVVNAFGTSNVVLFAVNPTISGLAPSSATAGGPAFNLIVNGAGFICDGDQVLWNGSPRSLTGCTSTQLAAAISASDIASGGIASIVVNSNQVPSSPATFTINNPVPTISGLSPVSVLVGSGALTLTVGGSNFVPTSSVRLNGIPYSTSFVSSTQLSVSIPASVVSSATTASVTVVNPAPGGGTSGAAIFTVAGPQINVSPMSLNFGDVLIGTPVARTLTVSNLESVPVPVNASTSFGSPYTIAPSTFTLPPNGSATAVVTFTPTAAALYDALASFLFTGGERVVGLTGRGTLTSFTFNYSISGQTAIPVLPGGTITFPATNVDSSSAVQFQVVNAGSTAATINTISSSGAVFPLNGVPTLPVTLAAGGNLSFTVRFAPTAPGNASGSLTVNNNSFALAGSATISPLTYRYTLPGGSPVTISPTGTVPLPPVAAGGTSSAQFQIVNPSSSPASVSTVTSSSSLFTLGTLPALPASIAAGGSLDLSLTFRPTTPGSSTAILTVGTQTFSLSGTGLATATTLTGLTDVVAPAQQPKVGVDLSSATTVPLTGQIVLSFTPTADVPSDDPAVQFATGGRSVNFTVPPNTTKGDFSGSPDVAFSTGTVAGALRLVVTLRSGSADVTPTSPDPNRTVTVERRVPTITSVALASRTTAGFEIVIVGYSTPRSLSQAAFRFAPRPGSNVQSPDVTVNVTNQFTTWYQGTDSQQFGSQFRLRIPFTVQGDINALGSVSVTLANAVGTSEPTSTSF